MNLKDLEAIIKTKLNYQYAPDEYRTWQYDGFDMSGFNNSAFHNMEILSRFKNYMNPINEENKRNLNFSTVTFWKGTGIIIDVTQGPEPEIEQLEEVSGDATCTIIRKLILLHNPTILKTGGRHDSKKTTQ